MKLGIAGTGRISEDALDAVSTLGEITVNALFPRPHSRKKGESLARSRAIPEVYTDDDAMLDQADIDTVYIALINRVHCDSRKAVICQG